MSSSKKDQDFSKAGLSFNARVAKLVGLTKPEEKSLLDLGISTEDDLSFVQFEDFPDSINVVKRRKLSLIGNYLSVGSKSLKDSTTMNLIKKSALKDKQTLTGTAQANPNPQAKQKSQPLKIGTNT